MSQRSGSWTVVSLALAVAPLLCMGCSSGGRNESNGIGGRPKLKATAETPVPPSLDGTVSTATATGTSTISIPHTTGAGTDRLLLVGIAANSYSTSRPITSVTFTPSGGSAIALSAVGSIENGAGRLAAIYSLLNPPAGVAGAVAVTFSGSVGNGIVAGAANFQGVDQTTPLAPFATATGNSTAVSLAVPSNENSLVFDAVFLGASAPPTATADPAQSALWNAITGRVRGVASTKLATAPTTTMSWTASATAYWAAIGVPINATGTGGPFVPNFNILLGRPTNASITANVIPDRDGELYLQYGTSPGDYSAGQTATVPCVANQPLEVVISGLSADTQYYYRLAAKPASATDWGFGVEHAFRTQRTPGDGFTFTVTSDSHVNVVLGSSATWTQTMNNVAGDHPDFSIDLGDAFAMDAVTDVAGAETAYRFQRQFFGLAGNSAAIFLALGNHDQQEGWHLDDTGDPATSPPVLGVNAQKKYFLNPVPVPDGFYTGNGDVYSYLSGDNLRQDYYAWTWGDALFVVIDPFWYTATKPYTGDQGGGEASDTGSGDRWDWTLGKAQYDWLKQTLEGSHAKYKFIFAHQMTGGSDDYVRGGANAVQYVEWGGYDEDGTTWAWETRRPGWAKPVHQMLLDNHVSAFFHGHDHQYAYEKREGMVYQAVPAAGFSSNFGIYTTGSGYTIQAMDGPGHLRVAVAAQAATVDYIATTGATVNYSYAMTPSRTIQASAPGGHGTITPASVTVYDGQPSGDFTITPEAGYRLLGLTDNGTDVSGNVVADKYAIAAVTADHVLVATFAIVEVPEAGDVPDGGPEVGPETPGCECHGTGPDDVPVTALCGETACGSDHRTYSCSADGWTYVGEVCPAGCQCQGTGPDGVPVTVDCGQSACGSDHRTYSCSADGWTYVGEVCPAACQCQGMGPGGVPVTVDCGQSACGSDYRSYACAESNWTYVGDACTQNPLCLCHGTGPGDVVVTTECGQSSCGSDYRTYACGATGWTYVGDPCTGN